MPASVASASSSSPLSACRCWPGRWRSSCCSDSSCCPSATAPPCPPISAAMPRTLVEQYGLASGIYQLRSPRDLALCRHCRVGDRSCQLSRAAARRHPGGRDGRPAAPLLVAEGDHSADARRCRGGRGVRGTHASRLPTSRRRWARVKKRLFNRSSGLAEVRDPAALRPDRPERFPGMVTESGDLIVLAVQRASAEIAAANAANGDKGGIVLQAGDTMLLQGTWKALDVHLDDPDVLVVNSPELVRRQAVPMGPGATPGHHHPASDGPASRDRCRYRLPWRACSLPERLSCRGS